MAIRPAAPIPLRHAWLLLALISTAPPAGTVAFRAGGMHCRAHVAGVPSRALRLLAADSSTARPALDALLDSLGFFAAVWDTVAADSLILRAGPRAEVESVLVAGDTSTLNSCPAAPGEEQAPPLAFPRPYDAGELAGTATALLERLGGAGYPFARADLRVDRAEAPDSGPPRVRLTVTVATGCRHVVDSTAFIGSRTRRRQLLHDTRLAPGTPYDLRLVRQARERLAGREYVDSVELLAPIPGRATDSGCAGDRGVVVPYRVTDRRGLALDGAVSLEQDPEQGTLVSGALEFGLLNVFGAGEKALLSYRGDRTLQRLSVALGKVYVGSLPLIVDGRFAVEIARDQYAFLEGALDGRYELRGPWRAGLGVHGQENTVTEAVAGGATWHVYGLDLLLDMPSPWPRRGVFSRGLAVRTGVERADRGEQAYLRWRADFQAGMQVPFGRRLALGASLTSRNVFAEESTLTPAEMYRVGGYRSLRGYPEDYIAVRSAACVQLDYLVYLAGEAAAYIFTDGGAGWREGIEHSATPVWMMGYGVGVRLPARIGSATVEWGRSIDDRRGFGRIHVRIANRLAQGVR